MIHYGQLVDDFFRIGANAWMKKYQGKVPKDASPENFVREIQARGFELRFIDQPTWTGDSTKDQPCYLVANYGGHKFAVLVIDRGAEIFHGTFQTLGEGILCKAENLLAMLSVRRARN